ncbi:hypothetical protein Naga_100418g1, partial [Nannochloropsis gaditana]
MTDMDSVWALLALTSTEQRARTPRKNAYLRVQAPVAFLIRRFVSDLRPHRSLIIHHLNGHPSPTLPLLPPPNLLPPLRRRQPYPRRPAPALRLLPRRAGRVRGPGPGPRQRRPPHGWDPCEGLLSLLSGDHAADPKDERPSPAPSVLRDPADAFRHGASRAGGRLHRGSASERPGPMDLCLCGGERDPGAHRHHVCSPFPPFARWGGTPTPSGGGGAGGREGGREGGAEGGLDSLAHLPGPVGVYGRRRGALGGRIGAGGGRRGKEGGWEGGQRAASARDGRDHEPSCLRLALRPALGPDETLGGSGPSGWGLLGERHGRLCGKG